MNGILKFVFMLCGVGYQILGVIITADSGVKSNGILFTIAGVLCLILVELKEQP